MKIFTIIIIAIVSIAVLLIIKNKVNCFKSKEKEIEQLKNDVSRLLAERYEELMKLGRFVNACTGTGNNMCDNVIVPRKDMNIEQLAQTEAIMDNAYAGLFEVIEAHPEASSYKGFAAFRKKVTDTEETLKATDRVYNEAVREYNKKLGRFPGVIIAPLAKARRLSSYEAMRYANSKAIFQD